MEWSPEAYHKIIMTDLKELSREIVSFSPNFDTSEKRYRLQEAMRFAQNIVNNAALAIRACNEVDRG